MFLQWAIGLGSELFLTELEGNYLCADSAPLYLYSNPTLDSAHTSLSDLSTGAGVIYDNLLA